MKKNYTLLIIIIIVILVLLAVVIVLANDDKDKVANSTTTEKQVDSNEVIVPGLQFPSEKVYVPDFTLNDLDGNEISLLDYRGKIVVINFWASWCPPCKAEMPDFEIAHNIYNPEKIVILAINATDGIRETEKKARNYIDENQFTFKVLLDKAQKVTSNYGISAFPTTLVINTDGSLYGYRVGQLNKDILLNIEKMLAN